MKLRSAIAAASVLLGPVLATCGVPSVARADGITQPGVVAVPRQWEWNDRPGAVAPRPYLGFQWESGLRYWYSTGSHQFNLGGLTSLNPLVSRLTWSDLTAHSAETFFRADHWSGVFVKGSLGAGSIVGGNLKDEDFPPGAVPYSSTSSGQRDGDIQYLNIDLGYAFWKTPDHRVGAFVGYGNWDERVRAFGCVQTAGNPAICVPAIPAAALGITHKYDWDFWRLGLVGDTRLWHGFALSGEVAWLPGATLSGSDTHHWRPSALLGGFNGATPFDATSGGVQLEAVLKYAVTSNFDVGVGGRYWHVTDGDGKTHFNVSVPGALPQFSSSSSERSGVFVQGSYRFDSGSALTHAPSERAYVAPASVFTWTGLYAGVNAGYGEGSDNVKFAYDPVYFGAAASVGNVPTQLSASNRGILGGAQIGYNWRFGSLGLIGAEADFAWARIDGANSFTDVNFGLFNTTVERKLASLGTVRARLGFLGAPNLLVYGTGGLAYGETGLSVAVTNLASCAVSPGCLSSSNSGVKAGWTVGGGYELAIGHGISWKTEYLYADLGSRSATVTSPFGPPGNFYTGSTDFHEHIIRTGVNFTFGAREELVPAK